MPDGLAGKVAEGQEIVVGIRPESFHLDEESGLTIPARAEIAELTGPELIVTAIAGDRRILAALPPRTQVRDGQSLKLSFDLEAIHLFDAQSERRIG